jgi:hypothetical protein
MHMNPCEKLDGCKLCLEFEYPVSFMAHHDYDFEPISLIS